MAALRVADERIGGINRAVDTFNVSRPFSVHHLFRLRLRLHDEVGHAVRTVRAQGAARAHVDIVRRDEVHPFCQLFARLVPVAEVREYERSPSSQLRTAAEDGGSDARK